MMISSWRGRRGGIKKSKQLLLSSNNIEMSLNMEVTIPSHFRCPISLDLMKDPVTLSTGMTYDRQSIETWIEAGNYTCPVTNQVLRSLEPIPNHTIRRMIQDWCVENSSYGIERIPTPRIPISTTHVVEILGKITDSARRGDQNGCIELVRKIKSLGKESERNRRCIVSTGSASVVSAAFEVFSSSTSSTNAASPFEKNVGVLEEFLLALTWMCPFDNQTEKYLGSPASLRAMVWLSKGGSISGRCSAVLVLKELLSLDQKYAEALALIEGAYAALFDLIKEPICPSTTKASLMVIYYMVSLPDDKKIKSRFAGMGLVSLLVEILVDCEKSICEKALGVLDRIFDANEGLEVAYNHVLTMPVLVKKLLRVSDLATEFAVSILLKLCKNDQKGEEQGGVLVEGLRAGAFQKLLLLLQVGCSEKTKERVTELLKMMNVHRHRAECIETMDFKQLNRPF